jgi:hypothetical protein
MQPKLLPLSGIAFVALVALSLGIGGGTPEPGESGADVVSFYDDNEARQFITSFVFAATVPFLVLFAVGLARSVETHDDRGSIWGQVALAGAILAGGAILATAAIHFALLDAATSGDRSPEAALALNALDGSTWIAYNAGLGVMMLGAAGLFVSAAIRQRWLGWIALVLGIAIFIPFADFIALLLTLVWIVVTSVMLARRAAVPSREPQLERNSTVATTS